VGEASPSRRSQAPRSPGRCTRCRCNDRLPAGRACDGDPAPFHSTNSGALPGRQLPSEAGRVSSRLGAGAARAHGRGECRSSTRASRSRTHRRTPFRRSRDHRRDRQVRSSRRAGRRRWAAPAQLRRSTSHRQQPPIDSSP
jgi:hypothetical protein